MAIWGLTDTQSEIVNEAQEKAKRRFGILSEREQNLIRFAVIQAMQDLNSKS